jgi:hypothetical protein
MGEVEPRELRRGSSGNRPHGGPISALALPLSGQVWASPLPGISPGVSPLPGVSPEEGELCATAALKHVRAHRVQPQQRGALVPQMGSHITASCCTQ